MLIRLLESLRSNVIGYLALGISLLALSGGAYAAFTLPANSVGGRQIRSGAVGARQIHNGSVSPVKLNHSMIGGSIRHWAQINSQGQVVSSSGGAFNEGPLNSGGRYLIGWGHDTFSPDRCAVIATVSASLGAYTPPSGGGFATADSFLGAAATLVDVRTFNTLVQPASEPFSLAVIC